MRLVSLARRLDRLEAGSRRSLSVVDFAHVPDAQLQAAAEILRAAFESGNFDEVNIRLAADAPTVLATRSPARL